MNRGSAVSHRRGPWRRPRFNEAPIHESGKCRFTGRRAARSPRGFNEAPIHESGKWLRPRRPAAVRSASMRPRFMNRGSDGRVKLVKIADAASMRPRFMNRGST